MIAARHRLRSEKALIDAVKAWWSFVPKNNIKTGKALTQPAPKPAEPAPKGKGKGTRTTDAASSKPEAKAAALPVDLAVEGVTRPVYLALMCMIQKVKSVATIMIISYIGASGLP
jgi:hypothetical protein